MAKITPGAIISEIRGSIAGVTYSRNKGGAYSKAKLIQTNPNSTEQQAMRTIQANGVIAWQSLTDDDQSFWNVRAESVPRGEGIRTSKGLSGFNLFLRFYIAANFYGSSGVPDYAPAEGIPTIEVGAITNSLFSFGVTVTGTNTDPDLRVIVKASGPVSPGKTTVTPTLLTVMANEEVPNGSTYINIYDVYVPKWGDPNQSPDKKIFLSVEFVNRRTAQHTVVWRSSEYTSYEYEYQDILDYATSQAYTLPSVSVQRRQSQLIGSLKAAGLWTVLDVLYIYANDAGLDFCKINWKDPNYYEATLGAGLTLVSNTGILGNGSASIDIPFAPSIDGVNFTQNDASWILGVYSNTAESHNVLECNPTNNRIYLRVAPTAFIVQLNSTSGGSYSMPTTKGLWHVQRTASNNVNTFQNGVLLQASPLTSVALTASTIQLLLNSSRGLNCFAAGASLSGSQAVLSAILSSYFATI